jgi:hypothetical protein
LRVNLGGRTKFQGVVLDLALHYVSAYSFPLADPRALLNEREYREVGNHFMLVGRLGYRLELNHNRHLEAGLTVRTPLGVKGFREYPGMVMPQTAMRENQSDWGGEFLMRLLDFYLRAVF